MSKFSYTYSAPTENERREIEDIKKQYDASDEKEDKLARLKSLDAKVKRAPLIASIALGVLGTLIFGTGLTLILEWALVVWGIVVSAVGCVPIALAYPVRKLLLARNKSKYGAEIVKLSDELLNKDENRL